MKRNIEGSFPLILALAMLFGCADDEVAADDDSDLDTRTAFHRAVGAAIPHDTAHAWMNNYRTANPNRIRSHFFGVDTFNALLAREGIVGISLEYAINDAGEPQIILIGVEAAGHYMLSPPSSGDGKRSSASEAYDASAPCLTSVGLMTRPRPGRAPQSSTAALHFTGPSGRPFPMTPPMPRSS